MVVTIPSPTRAMIVSSVAPPTSRSMFVRTVTRALALSWMPSLATASTVWRPLVGSGQSMTFGLTLVWIASSTLRPGQVDGGGPLPRQRDVGPVGGDQGPDDVRHVAAGQVVGLQVLGWSRRPSRSARPARP